jgi:uncharacterized protein (TIGR02452 family)
VISGTGWSGIRFSPTAPIKKNMNLVDVYNDTLKITGGFQSSPTTKHTTDDIDYPEDLDFNAGTSRVVVDQADSVSALVGYARCLERVCVLNMASPKRPGGGVARGARAQEECLFRCSNLGHAIPSSFYPLEDNECLYTRDAVFVKDFNYNLLPNPVVADVITIPAIHLTDHDLCDNYEQITKQKIRLMLSVPWQNKARHLILGAWGCGVFRNDPETMAGFFRDVLETEGFKYFYDTVVFAVINDKNSVGNNLEIFSQVLSA